MAESKPGCATVLAGFALVPFSAIVQGLTLRYVWDVIPVRVFHVPRISLAGAVGIAVLIGLVLSGVMHEFTRIKEPDNSLRAAVIRMLVQWFLYGIIALETFFLSFFLPQ